MNIVCMTQQFRVRDSTHCNFYLWCESQPVIQSSHNLKFTCFPSQIKYSLLLNQMQEAKLKLWNNNWFDIYDFTIGKYGKNVMNYQNVDTIQCQSVIVDKINSKI